MAGKYLRGAFIWFARQFIRAIPNVIVFQYNPETMTHGWSQQAPPQSMSTHPFAVGGEPEETFSFSLAMDARDVIADASRAAADLAADSGLYTRLAALEMLQYPVEFLEPATKTTCEVSGLETPAVLFAFGVNRIVPVRVTSLSITEKLYDPWLNPVHAEATIALSVLTAEQVETLSSPMKQIARAAHEKATLQRKKLAAQNLANAADGAIAMVPF